MSCSIIDLQKLNSIGHHWFALPSTEFFTSLSHLLTQFLLRVMTTGPFLSDFFLERNRELLRVDDKLHLSVFSISISHTYVKTSSAMQTPSPSAAPPPPLLATPPQPPPWTSSISRGAQVHVWLTNHLDGKCDGSATNWRKTSGVCLWSNGGMFCAIFGTAIFSVHRANFLFAIIHSYHYFSISDWNRREKSK